MSPPTVVVCLLSVVWMLTPQASQRPREPTQLIYDAGARQILLLSSSGEAGQEQLWRWDSSGWTRLPAVGPPARHLGGAAYDTRRGRLVLQGGISSSSANDRKGDTWEWDGGAWREINAPGLGPRDHHAMAYDESRGRIVLFGGSATGTELATDTWEYDGRAWTRVATNGPPGRAHFGMAYDASRGQVVIFGGLAQFGATRQGAANDTWAWDGRSWQKLADGGPPPRTHTRMVFDRRLNRLVLFGGQRGPMNSFGDTWTWSGREWTEVKTSGPPARSWHVMAYDEARGRTVLYGGSIFDGKTSTQFQDTWEFDGSRWARADP